MHFVGSIALIYALASTATAHTNKVIRSKVIPFARIVITGFYDIDGY